MGVFDSIIYGVKTYTPGTVFSDAQSVPTEQDKILDIAVSESAKRLAESPTSIGYELNRLGDADKYSKVGLQRNIELLRAQREGNLEKILADSQSNFQKTRNALAQTLVSEVGLGTLKGFSDLFDLTIGNVINLSQGVEQDYENPVSAFLAEKQKEFEEYMPIYSDPTRNTMWDGGLGNWGWWMQNVPSIMSSLTLMIPGEGIVAGLSKVGKLAKLGKLGKGIRRATTLGRRAMGIERAEKAEQMAKLGISAGTSRLIENYQEANQVYQDMYEDAAARFKEMSQPEYEAWVERHRDDFDENFDFSDKDAVAKNIAKQSANETFVDDLWNGVFDVYQLYALKNVTRIMNAPLRASVRRKHLDSMKYIDKMDKIDEIKAARKWYQKLGEKVGDYAYGSATAIGAELSEGIEEAVNYIAQQEGMHFGKVLLEQEAPSPTTRRLLQEYMMAPELYDSAFWGVLGGVVFQGLGSAVKRAENVIATQTDDRYKTNEKTGEQIKKPTLLESWTLPEIKMRTANIEARTKTVNDALNAIQQIKDGTYKDSNGNTPTTESEKEVARREVFNNMVTEVLLQSQDAGNYDLAKEFLTNDNVIKFLVDNGITTEESAAETKASIESKVEQLDALYDKHFRAIDNALRGRDRISGVDLEDMPIEYFKIVARQNIKHELKSQDYNEKADKIEEEIKHLEEQNADNLEGKNYRQQIEHVVVVVNYVEALKSLDALENDTKNRGTLLNQHLIKEQKKKIKTLEDYIVRTSSPTDTSIDKMARFLSAYQQGRNSLLSNTTDPARRREIAEKYKAFDEAILRKDINFFKKLSDVFGSLDTETEPMQTLESAVHQATILNQDIERNLKDKNKFYSEVAEFSQDLANDYARVTDLRLASIMENAMVSTKKSDIIDTIDALHNTFFNETGTLSMRAIAIENANDHLLRLAKEYGSENVLAYINAKLKANKGQGFEELGTTNEIEGMSAQHKRTLDEALEVLNLTAAPNINIVEQIQRNLEESAARDYAEIGDIDDIYKSETKESSTALQNPAEGTKTEKVDNSSVIPPNTDDDDVSSKFGTFAVDKANKPLPKPMARITANDDGSFTFSQIDLNNPLDSDVPVIEGENGEIEIDLKTLFEENPAHPIFTNEDVVNLDGNTTLDDNIEVVANPQFVIDDDNKAKLANKGQIRKQGEEELEVSNTEFINALETEEASPELIKNVKEELNNATVEEYLNSLPDDSAAQYLRDLYDRLKKGEKPIKPAPSSTGGPIIVGGNIDRAAEPAYDPTSLKGDVQMIIMKYLRDNSAYDESAILDIAKQQLEGVPEEDIKAQIEGLRNWLRRKSEAKGYDKVIAALDELEMASEILDEQIKNDGDTNSARELLNGAFKTILDEYAKHCALDVYKGITYINLTNLLSYLNSATDNEYTAEVVFQNILKVINAKDSGYKITDGNYTENEYIARAKMNTEELSEVVSNGSIQKINLASFLDYIKQTSESDEEYEARRNEILDAVENAQIGDKLEYNTTDKGRVEIKYNGTVIGSMPIPNVNKEGTHYVMINEGWKTDVPINDGDSAFYKMLEEIFVSGKYDSIVSLIRNATYTPVTKKVDGKYVLNEDFIKAADIIIDKIREIEGINIDELISDKNNAGNIQYSNVDRVKHLIKLYSYVKSISEKQAVASKENLDSNPLMGELQRLSLNGWMSKLKNSYDALRALATDDNLDIEIASITEGGPITTDELHPINEAIGDKHKGKIQLAVSSVTQPGVLHVSGSDTVSDPGIMAGRSRIVINSKQSWNVKAIPAKFDSINFKGNEAGEIIKEIIDEFDKILNRWGEKPTKTDLSELEKFIKTLTSRNAGNQPFVQGIRITNKSDENHINLECTTENGIYYINFWNKSSKEKTASNVEIIERDTNKKTLEPQSYLKSTTKAPARDAVLDLLKKSMGFNMNPNYVISDNNRTYPLQGIAKRNKEGKFVIKIGENKEHVFDSYADFVIGQNVVNVNTMHDDEGSNVVSIVDGGNITFKINSKTSSPVEERKTGTPIRNLGEETLKILERGGDNVGLDIFKLVLNDTQLKNLKNSKILEHITPKNIIFVSGFEHIAAFEPVAKDINGVHVPAGYVVIGQKFIDLLNSKSENAAADHLEAIRHLIHEGLHSILSNPENKKAVDAIREIFDKFVEANQSLPENEGIRLFEYTFSEDAKKRYYTDGKINLKGLEEFLVESLTRPVLMKRLNEISQNNRKVGSERDIKYTRGNLFQRLLSALADLLGIKINKNSLLSREYEIFRDLFKTAKETTPKVSENGQLELEFKEETEETKPAEEKVEEEVEEEVEEKPAEERYNFDDTEGVFSEISDEFVSSKAISDKLAEHSVDDSRKFEKMLNEGLINITCK